LPTKPSPEDAAAGIVRVLPVPPSQCSRLAAAWVIPSERPRAIIRRTFPNDAVAAGSAPWFASWAEASLQGGVGGPEAVCVPDATPDGALSTRGGP